MVIVDSDYSVTGSLKTADVRLVLERICTRPEKLVLLMRNTCAARAFVITLISN